MLIKLGESLFTTYNGSSSDKINIKLYNNNTKTSASVELTQTRHSHSK